MTSAGIDVLPLKGHPQERTQPGVDALPLRGHHQEQPQTGVDVVPRQKKRVQREHLYIVRS